MLKHTNLLTKVYGIKDGHTLAVYEREARGYEAAKKVLTSMTREQVVDVRSGRVVSGGRMAVRQLLGIPLALLLGAVTCGVGWLFAGWLVVSPSRQGLWDRIARTTVREVP